MSRYDELAGLAREAATRREQNKNNGFKSMTILINGLKQYLQIPDECVRYLRWSKDSETFGPPLDGGKYESLVQAADYDEEEQEWKVGLRLIVGVGGAPSIAFGLFFKDRAGQVTVRLGPDISSVVDPNVQTQREDFYAKAFARMEEVFREQKAPPKGIGFSFS